MYNVELPNIFVNTTSISTHVHYAMAHLIASTVCLHTCEACCPEMFCMAKESIYVKIAKGQASAKMANKNDHAKNVVVHLPANMENIRPYVKNVEG